MSKHCAIMQRMKANYESRSRTFLTRRTPVIMRLDGKAFHTYTRDLDKPFDEGLIQDMQETAIYLCKNIQGAKCAYVQSDEISILITDYDTLQTDAWFDYNIQKMCSISASLATGIFNKLRYQRIGYEVLQKTNTLTQDLVCEYKKRLEALANFDSRVFNIPKEEVANYFLARQKDAVKNSVSMLAQSLYPHKELHLKNSSEMQEMCFQKGHNWNDLHFSKKRGSFIIKNTYVNNVLMHETVNIPHPFRSNPEIGLCENGDILYNPTTSTCIITTKYLDKEGEECVKYDEIVKPIIRSKWEVIETPFTFTDSDFKKWL